MSLISGKLTIAYHESIPPDIIFIAKEEADTVAKEHSVLPKYNFYEGRHTSLPNRTPQKTASN